MRHSQVLYALGAVVCLSPSTLMIREQALLSLPFKMFFEKNENRQKDAMFDLFYEKDKTPMITPCKEVSLQG